MTDDELLAKFWALLDKPNQVDCDKYFDGIKWVTKRPKLKINLEVVENSPFQYSIERNGDTYDIEMDPRWDGFIVNYAWIIALIALDDFEGKVICTANEKLDAREGSYDHARHYTFVTRLLLPDEQLRIAAGQYTVPSIARAAQISTGSVIAAMEDLGIATYENVNLQYRSPELNRQKWYMTWTVLITALIISSIALAYFECSKTARVILALEFIAVGIMHKDFFAPGFNYFKRKYRSVIEWFYR